MPQQRKRIEPSLGDTSDAPPSIPVRFESTSASSSGHSLRALIRILTLVLIFTSLFFVGDRALDRYREYRAMQALEAQLQALEDMMQQSTVAIQARQGEQRRARARSTRGRALGRNCLDWRRAHADMPGYTTKTEMDRACGEYERYLRSGR